MIHVINTTMTTAAGVASLTTLGINGEMKFFYLSPLTATTTYKVSIVNEDNITVKFFDFTTGVLRDYTPLLLFGVHTIQISGATVDELFTVVALIEEKH